MSTNTYQTRQSERIHSLRVTENLFNRVEAYADDNSLSLSEAMREILSAYANGDVLPPERQRRTRRMSVWAEPEEWIKFTNRAARDGVVIADAVEAAIREAL